MQFSLEEQKQIYREHPELNQLVRSLNYYDEYQRAYALKWAYENLPYRPLCLYHKIASSNLPYLRQDEALYVYWMRDKLDQMKAQGERQQALDYRADRDLARWEALKSWADPDGRFATLSSDADDFKLIYGMTEEQAKAMGPDTETGGGDVSQTSPQTFDPTGGGQQSPQVRQQSQQAGFDVTNPMNWINLLDKGTDVVKKNVCMADPLAPICTGGKVPTTLAELCQQTKNAIPACQQLVAQDAYAKLCQQYPAQCQRIGVPGYYPPAATTSNTAMYVLGGAALLGLLYLASQQKESR